MIALMIALAVMSSGCDAQGSAASSSTAAQAPGVAGVRLGVDVIQDSLPSVLVGRRVGLITNHTGRDSRGRSTIDILAADSGLTLVALYAPEHGLRGTAAEGATIASGRDAETGLPIHSLYGATRQPTPAMLEGVEALVFDIQDVGSRTYTYPYTMALGMRAAKEKGIPFVVLDRPDPVGGVVVEGGVLDSALASFVGMYPIALRHGMTVGELAGMFNDAFGIGANLTVVRMDGWRRDMWFDQTGLTWVAPSPNLPRLESAVSYPGTVFFEGINLSEGRGSDHPFEQTGSPWLRADTVVAEMERMGLAGVHFEAVTFTPATSAAKFPGQELHGVRIVVTDRDSYRPVDVVARLIDTIRRLHPADFRFTGNSESSPDIYWLDRLAGTRRLRQAMERGTLGELLDEWQRDAAGFDAARQRYLLY